MADITDGVPEFVAVVEAKGFRAAGRQLGVSGTAVSKALRQLEQRLGVTLLLRTTRSVRLTEAGETFYAAARQARREFSSTWSNLGCGGSYSRFCGFSCGPGGVLVPAGDRDLRRRQRHVRQVLR